MYYSKILSYSTGSFVVPCVKTESKDVSYTTTVLH